MEIISQCIDESGKCRIINYGKDDEILISLTNLIPLPPLKVNNVKYSEIVFAKKNDVEEFISSKNFEITEQLIANNDELQGIWIKGKNEFLRGYIPTEDFEKFDKIEESDENSVDPVSTYDFSNLRSINKNKFIAYYLKEYSCIELAHSKNDKLNVQDNYHISPNYEYKNIYMLGEKVVRNKANPVLYNSNKLIVPDTETANRLISYAKLKFFNDYSKKELYKNLERINAKKFFSSLDEFRNDNKQLIFTSVNSLMKWKNRKLNYTVLNDLDAKTKSPYYYMYKDKLCIIQNVKGNKENAQYVSMYWKEHKLNKGYFYDLKNEMGEEYSKYVQNIRDIEVIDYGDTYGAILDLC